MFLWIRINGFIVWVNLRLLFLGYFMYNILMDLLKGYNMKVFLESKYLLLVENIILIFGRKYI